MTDNNHPITPPDELVQQWTKEAGNRLYAVTQSCEYVAIQAVRWGADQELEACCELLDINGCPGKWIDMLRAARRPNPPSLQDQALDDLERIAALLMKNNLPCDTGNIRRALEALHD